MLWSESLETGIKEIDDCNRKLFSYIDNFVCEDASGDPETVLACLEERARNNFLKEEKLHEQTEYPDAEPHRRFHDSYMAALRRMKKRLVEEGLTLANMLAFNRAVVGLQRHVQSGDMDFADYYADHA